MSKPKDDTVGQSRRATDSRPRPGSGTPAAERSKPDKQNPPATEDGDRKPSASWSPIDPGRPVARK